MKHAKKKAAKKTPARKPDSPPPEKLYRPFEKLAKKTKERPEPAPASKAKTPQGQSSAQGRAPESKSRAGAATPNKPAAGKPNSSRSAAPPEPSIAAADAETFALYMAGVRELDDRATRIPRTASRIERAAKGTLPAIDADAPARAQLQALVAEGIRFETSDDGERIEGRRIEIEPREVRRLRRGQYTVDQQIDLHGLNVPEARKSIETFVEKRRKEGDRVIRIIHGKGGHSPRGVSVLRGEIAAWLSQGPAKRHVASFATAPPEDGGAGALLVLLMRPRA